MGGQRSAPARTSRRKGDPQPLSTQPGHSWKYLYERLTEKRFQQLCGALLRHDESAEVLCRCFVGAGSRVRAS